MVRRATHAGSPYARDLDGIERAAASLPGATDRVEHLRTEGWASAQAAAQARDDLGTASAAVCSTAQQILAEWDVPDLERLRAVAETAFDRASAEHDRARTGIQNAAKKAEEIEDLAEAAGEVDAARALVPGIQPQRAAAAAILAQSEADLGTVFEATAENKGVLRDMRAVYADITSRTDAGACLEQEDRPLASLDTEIAEALAASKERDEHLAVLENSRPSPETLEVLRAAARDARATADAADLFSDSVERRFEVDGEHRPDPTVWPTMPRR